MFDLLKHFAANTCITTALFGEVCDDCNGGAIFKILAVIIQVLSIGIGAAAVIGIIISGIQYMTSAGDQAKLTKAKNRIIEVVIGILAYGLLFTFLEFIIPGGIIGNSLDASTTCPEIPAPHADPGTGGGGGGGSSGGGGGGASDGGDGDDIDQSQVSLGGEKAPYFLSDPVTSCPKNTKHSDAGLMIDYTSGDLTGYSVVNTPMDVVKYAQYLQANHISMDGKTCMTNGSCNSSYYYDDGGNCEKFAPTFAGNLNGNACVSNDAFASHMGRTDTQMFSESLWVENNKASGSGNFYDVPKRVEKLYFDPRLNFDSSGKSAAVFSSRNSTASSRCEISKMILSELVDHGRPIVVRIRDGSGHWAVAVGVKTATKEAYTSKTGGCSGGVPSLDGRELVILNTDGKVHINPEYYSALNNNNGTYRVMTSCGKSYCD